MQATIILEYSDAKTAKVVANVVSPDNLKTPSGLKIKTITDGCKVVTDIDYRGKIVTFTATIDDLLFSAILAEKTLRQLNNQ